MHTACFIKNQVSSYDKSIITYYNHGKGRIDTRINQLKIWQTENYAFAILLRCRHPVAWEKKS
jgi:hypothetical protein